MAIFKLPGGIPNLRTSAQDWADYAEYKALCNNQTPITFSDLFKSPQMISDETDDMGAEDDSDRFVAKIDDIASEIRYRINICPGRYPFRLENRDYSIRFSPLMPHSDLVYSYLLMSTRVKMGRNRIHADIDGALLFERLAATVVKSYFGENAEVDVFGTSRLEGGGFRQKLTELVNRMGEGGKIHDNDGFRPQDGNVDLVVWKGFTDRLPSKMIAFGQCKTGTSWTERLSELNTRAFCNTWFSRQPILTPVRLFCCAQYFPRDLWSQRAYEAGLVFDRFRLMDYLPENIEAGLLTEIENWTTAVRNEYRNA